jgi:hypothetical protein
MEWAKSYDRKKAWNSMPQEPGSGLSGSLKDLKTKTYQKDPATNLKGQKLSCAEMKKSHKTIKMALLGPATTLKG